MLKVFKVPLAEPKQLGFLNRVDLFHDEALIMSLNNLLAALTCALVLKRLLENAMVLLWIETLHKVLVLSQREFPDRSEYLMLVLINAHVQVLNLLRVLTPRVHRRPCVVQGKVGPRWQKGWRIHCLLLGDSVLDCILGSIIGHLYVLNGANDLFPTVGS